MSAYYRPNEHSHGLEVSGWEGTVTLTHEHRGGQKPHTHEITCVSQWYTGRIEVEAAQ